jgi:hypothetical protein
MIDLNRSWDGDSSRHRYSKWTEVFIFAALAFSGLWHQFLIKMLDLLLKYIHRSISRDSIPEIENHFSAHEEATLSIFDYFNYCEIIWFVNFISIITLYNPNLSFQSTFCNAWSFARRLSVLLLLATNDPDSLGYSKPIDSHDFTVATKQIYIESQNNSHWRGRVINQRTWYQTIGDSRQWHQNVFSVDLNISIQYYGEYSDFSAPFSVCFGGWLNDCPDEMRYQCR